MDFVCCAAGRGKRLGLLGNYLNKPMYPVLDKPFLAYTLDQLAKARDDGLPVERLIMVVGHMQHQVRTYFGSEYRRLPIHYVEQASPRGTGDAVYTAFTAMRPDNPFIAWLGDIYVPRDAFMAIAATTMDTLSLYRHPCPRPHARVDLAPDGTVLQCWPPTDSDLIDIGTWQLSPDCAARLGQCNTGERRTLQAVQHHLDAGGQAHGIILPQWIHLGDEPTMRDNFRSVCQALAP